MKHSVSIVIPIYQNKLDENESLSLAQGLKILSRYPITVIKPQSLDLTCIHNQYPQICFENFDDEYFDGIYGYNRLMLSPLFYERFLQYDYILIYQLDAWVFRDELEYWCDKDYDYIGAPWIVKPKYNLLLPRLFIRLKSKYYKMRGKIFAHELLGNKVGNGGFSLRKVRSLYQSALRQKDKIEYYLEGSRKENLFNEDVFWALENSHFRYPPYTEALRFSFDRNAHIYMKMNNNKIPFGCHGWTKPLNINFWKDYIM